MENPFFDDPFSPNPDPDEEFMQEQYYYELFLDDYALFVDGLLSVEDARKMHQRSEISKEQLDKYIRYKQNEAQKQTNEDANPWAIALITIIVILVFLWAVLGGF